MAKHQWKEFYMQKKKDRENKKGEIHKMQQRNQQKLLSTDGDKEQVKETKEILVDAADKEQRRTTRLGATIAIVAVIGTICAFLFKMTISSLNVWAERGRVIYWYLQILFTFALSTSVIIFSDIVKYVISDLKRYNVLDQNYKQYDQESDNRYMCLISDFRTYTIMIFFIFILSVPLSVIYEKESQNWNEILPSVLCTFGVVALAVQWVIQKGKEEFKRIFPKAVGKIIKLILVALFCFAISAIFIVNNKAKISVSYNTDGIVEIGNTSAENYNGLDIEILNIDGKIIYTESVEKGKLLFALEDKYINNEIDDEKVKEGILINNEYLHWKYMFDLKKVINKPGKYYISITVYQDGKSAFLINSLSVENKEYVFAKDNMEKEY